MMYNNKKPNIHIKKFAISNKELNDRGVSASREFLANHPTVLVVSKSILLFRNDYFDTGISSIRYRRSTPLLSAYVVTFGQMNKQKTELKKIIKIFQLKPVKVIVVARPG
jgi:hypothetical protein